MGYWFIDWCHTCRKTCRYSPYYDGSHEGMRSLHKGRA